MTPQEAADLLKNSPGFSNYLSDPENTLNPLRDQFHSEAMQHLANALGTGDHQEAARQGVLAGQWGESSVDDPNSYASVQHRGMQAAQATENANEFMAPAETQQRAQADLEAANRAGSVAQAQSFGTDMGKANAAWTDTALHVADAASKRRMAEAQPAIDERMAAAQLKGTPKLSARADQTLQSIRQLSPLVGQLSTMLDPTNNSLMDKAGNMVKYSLYKAGISPDIIPGATPKDQARIQLAGLIKVLGASPYAASSRNFNFLKQAQEHLTDPGATDAMIAQQLDGLKQILPMFQQEILQNESNPAAPLSFNMNGGAGGAQTDPNDPLGLRAHLGGR